MTDKKKRKFEETAEETGKLIGKGIKKTLELEKTLSKE